MPPIKRILPYLISAVTSFLAMPLEKWHFMQRKKPHGSLFFVLCTINIPSLVPSLTSFSRNSVKLFWEDPSRNWFGYMRWRKNCTQRVICLLKAIFFFFFFCKGGAECMILGGKRSHRCILCLNWQPALSSHLGINGSLFCSKVSIKPLKTASCAHRQQESTLPLLLSMLAGCTVRVREKQSITHS